MDQNQQIEISLDEMFENFEKYGRDEYFLIDVRPEDERKAEGHIEFDDLRIHVTEIFENLEKIPKDKTIIFYCRSGGRSLFATNALRETREFKRVLNLKGGILEYNNKKFK